MNPLFAFLVGCLVGYAIGDPSRTWGAIVRAVAAARAWNAERLARRRGQQ